MNTGRDHVGGEVGSDGENIAVGKGQQQVHIDLGDRSNADIAAIISLVPRLDRVIFGDGYGGSIVDDLHDVKRKMEALDARMKSLETNLGEVNEQLSERRETSDRTQLLLMVIMIGVVVLVVIQLAQIWGGG